MRVNPKEIVKTFLSTHWCYQQTAQHLGIHVSTVYRWITKARKANGKVRMYKLRRKSTRPHTIHYALTPYQESAIIQLRRKKGYTAEKIKGRLQLTVDRNTIHRVLKREKLIHRYGNHRRPYYQKTTHMHLKNVKTIGYVQMDVKYLTPELTGLPWTCFEYAVIDIYSRYKEATILNHVDEDASITALLDIIPRLPFKPVFLQTDNGLEFQSRFHQHVEALGMKHHYIHKNTPNENAVIERSFRTDEEEFFFWDYKGAKDYDDLRTQFAAFLKEYNTERPHLGIDLKTPLEVIHLSQMS
jgi:transposase InsO family protein